MLLFCVLRIDVVRMSMLRVMDMFLLSRSIQGMKNVLRNSSTLESARSTVAVARPGVFFNIFLFEPL